MKKNSASSLLVAELHDAGLPLLQHLLVHLLSLLLCNPDKKKNNIGIVLTGSVRIPHLWLKDPHPDQDPAPFFSDFKDAKKKIFFNFFLVTYPQANYFQSLLTFAKILSKFYFASINSVRSTPLQDKGRIRIRTSY